MTYDEEHAIRRVIFDYAWAMDTQDWSLLGACFTERCQFSYGNGDPSLPHPHTTSDIAFTGRDDFVAYIAHTHEGVLSCHLMGASAVELDSVGAARSRTYARLLLERPGVGKFESAGVYADVLVKDEGRWRIGERRYTRLWSDGGAGVLRRYGDL